jgi:hypothetical protein
MSTDQGRNPDADEPQLEPADVPPTSWEVEQVLNRLSAEYRASARSLSEEIRQQIGAGGNERKPVGEYLRKQHRSKVTNPSSIQAPSGERGTVHPKLSGFERERITEPIPIDPLPQPSGFERERITEPIPIDPLPQPSGFARERITEPIPIDPPPKPTSFERERLTDTPLTAPPHFSDYGCAIVYLIVALACIGIAAIVTIRPFRNRNAAPASAALPVVASPTVPGTDVASQPSATEMAGSVPGQSPFGGQLQATQLPPSPQVAPTSQPSSIMSPTMSPSTAVPAETTSALTATGLLQQITQAEDALRTGDFQAVMTYSGGSGSTAQVRFDLGDEQQAARLHMISVYTGTEGSQTTERIIIGDRSWLRQSGSDWSETIARESVADQINIFLPHAATVSNAQVVFRPDVTELHWRNDDQGIDVTLIVDARDGTPRELRQETSATGELLVVTYNGWNKPVEINPPNDTGA